MNTRRDFFAFTAGTVAAKTMLPLAARAEREGHSTSSDTELIAVCAEFDAQSPLVDRMCKLRATTMEGDRARACSLALWDAELMKDGPGDTGECLTAAIVRDLLASDQPGLTGQPPEAQSRSAPP